MGLRIVVSILLLAAPLMLSKTDATSNGTTSSPQLHSYARSPAAKTRIQTSIKQFALWVNEAKWKQEKLDGTTSALSHISGEAWAVVMTGSAEVPTAVLPRLVWEDALKLDSNAKILLDDKRIVNGRELLAFHLCFTRKGVPSKALGYAYGGSAGTVIVLGAAAENNLAKYQQDIADLLNGLEITDPKPPSLANRQALPTPGFLRLTPQISLNYNPKLWIQQPSDNTNSYQFTHSPGFGYASVTADEVPLVTTDGLPMPLDTLPDAMLAPFRARDPTAAILFKENRRVNGTEVWFVKIESRVQNIPIIFCQYLYSGKAGMVIAMASTTKAAFGEYEKDCMDFLNGLRISELITLEVCPSDPSRGSRATGETAIANCCTPGAPGIAVVGGWSAIPKLKVRAAVQTALYAETVVSRS